MNEQKLINMSAPAKAVTYADDEIRTLTYRLLKAMNANPGLLGFKYTIEAVVILYRSRNCTVPITGCGGLYDRIAAQTNHATMQRVERAIRHLIEKMTANGNSVAINEIYGDNAFTSRPNHPAFITNTAFLQGIVNYLCYEAVDANKISAFERQNYAHN